MQGFAFTALESHEEGILEQLQPQFVIMYDPDIAIVRQLEVRLKLMTRTCKLS